MTGRGALSALTFAVLVNSAAPGGDTAIVARTLMRIDASDLRPCRWARFCPVNSAYVLASAGGREILLETVGGRTTALRDGDGPIGWLRESIVVVQAPPRYLLLECPSLRPATRVALGTVDLAPGAVRRGVQLSFHVSVAMRDEPGIPTFIPGADLAQYPVIAKERPASLRLPEHLGRTLVDGDGRTVVTCAKPIFGLKISPDQRKALMYVGNRYFRVYNTETAEFVDMPRGMKSWTWLPDSEALLGVMDTSSPEPASGTAGPVLRFYRLRGSEEVGIIMPDVPGDVDVRNMDVSVLDVSSDGKALVSVDFLGPKEIKTEYDRRNASEIESPVVKSEWRVLEIPPTPSNGATEERADAATEPVGAPSEQMMAQSDGPTGGSMSTMTASHQEPRALLSGRGVGWTYVVIGLAAGLAIGAAGACFLVRRRKAQ